MDQAHSTLLACLPQVGRLAKEILSDLAECHGEIKCADRFAQRFGLRNRHRLGRLLAREGLPPLRELTAWMKTLAHVAEWESNRVSLCRQALEAHKEPGTYYRTVQRATGMRWRDVRALGIGYVVLRFVERCGMQSEPKASADHQSSA